MTSMTYFITPGNIWNTFGLRNSNLSLFPSIQWTVTIHFWVSSLHKYHQHFQKAVRVFVIVFSYERKVTGGWYQKAMIVPQARPRQGERRMRKPCARWRFGSVRYLRIYLYPSAFERPRRAVRKSDLSLKTKHRVTRWSCILIYHRIYCN